MKNVTATQLRLCTLGKGQKKAKRNYGIKTDIRKRWRKKQRKIDRK
jgi:hypothetical protein